MLTSSSFIAGDPCFSPLVQQKIFQLKQFSAIFKFEPLPLLKYLYSLLTTSSCIAQVPCFSHSCCQKLSNSVLARTLVQWSSKSSKIGFKVSKSKWTERLQYSGPMVKFFVGQIPCTVHCFRSEIIKKRLKTRLNNTFI